MKDENPVEGDRSKEIAVTLKRLEIVRYREENGQGLERYVVYFHLVENNKPL